MGGPCTPWVTLDEVQGTPGAQDIDADVLQTALEVASGSLWRRSGRQYSGVCSDTVRPLRRMYALDGGLGGWAPLWGWRDGINAHSCGYPPNRNCGCGPLPEITLGAYPIRDIIEVRIDGAVLDPAAYRVDDRRWLVRIDGQSWPCCSDLSKNPLTDPNTFQVTFEWGQSPPPGGTVAARVLAVEIGKMLTGSDCDLPRRLQNVTFNGSSYTLLDPMNFLNDGLTGIYIVDLFLTDVNPHKLQRRSSVISPDIPRPVRRTAVAPGS